MLKRNRLMCVVLPLFFVSPSTLTPFCNKATQVFEKQVDNNNKMVLKTDKYGLLINPIQEQFEKDKIELEKKKSEELKLQKEKELQEQKKNEIQWQEFELTFYSGLACENSPKGAITCTGSKLYDGIVASNHYKLGTKIQLQGFGEVVVGDRGSDKYFNNDYRLDVFISRNQGESDSHYYSRVNKMGKVKIKGHVIKEGLK